MSSPKTDSSIDMNRRDFLASTAAAGGAMASSARVPVGVTFDADHPFLYLIRDISTGQLIFAGQQTTAA